MIKMYGIPNCNTVKKSKDWFEKHKLAYEFYNYKTEGIGKEKLKEWADKIDWKILLNKKGTTWRKIAPTLASENLTKAQALKLMQENTSLIKRPVIERSGAIIVGFDEAVYNDQLSNKKKK